MEFNELLYKRRSVREFLPDAVSEEKVNLLLESATRAPNACNFQSWHFYAIKNQQIINSFYPDIYSGNWITTTPLLIVVCTDAEKLNKRFGERGSNLFAVQDTAAAINNILLQAANIELGGCWIGAFNESKCSELLMLPENHRPVALLPIGKPKSEPAIRERKPISEVVTIIN